jgi:hypothetical protein
MKRMKEHTPERTRARRFQETASGAPGEVPVDCLFPWMLSLAEILSSKKVSALGCGFSRWLQHTEDCASSRSVATTG